MGRNLNPGCATALSFPPHFPDVEKITISYQDRLRIRHVSLACVQTKAVFAHSGEAVACADGLDNASHRSRDGPGTADRCE